MVPVLHKPCGSQVGWFVGARDEIRLRSMDFKFMDGSHPEFGAMVRIYCAVCKRPVSGHGELKRCFDEVDRAALDAS